VSRVCLDSSQVDSVPQERGQVDPSEPVEGVLLALVDLPATTTSATIQAGSMCHPLEHPLGRTENVV
jgi:hypothetical protein